MRVLFLTHQYFPHHIGGTEMLVRGLARRLMDRGDEAAVITYVESTSGHLPDHGFRVTAFDGVPVWELHWNLSVSPHPAEAEYHNAMIAELVARAAREIAPDVVHAAHVMKLSAAVVPRLKRDGLPLIVTLSDFWPLCLRHTLLKPDAVPCVTGPEPVHVCLKCAQATHGFAAQETCVDEATLWDRAAHAAADPRYPDESFRRDVIALAQRKDAVRDALLQADRIIALSEFQRSVFLKHGYPTDRIEILPHGVDSVPLQSARNARRVGIAIAPLRKVVFMGTLAVHKGPHILIEAMRAARDDRLALEIFGAPGNDAGYVASLQQLAGDDPRIIFRGVLPPERQS